MNGAPNFNRVAGLYRWMELFSFGPFLWRCRCAFLPQIRSSHHALVLGDGDGRFTARLLAENPTVQIHAIDGSSVMLRALIDRTGPHASRVQTELADLRHWQPQPQSDNATGPYDLVVTHFFLDCLTTEEVQSLAQRIRPIVSPSALWVVSEFAIPPDTFGSVIARPIVRSLYLAFGWLTGLTVNSLPDHHAALTASGFTLAEQCNWLGGLLVSDLWSVTAKQHNPNP